MLDEPDPSSDGSEARSDEEGLFDGMVCVTPEPTATDPVSELFAELSIHEDENHTVIDGAYGRILGYLRYQINLPTAFDMLPYTLPCMRTHARAEVACSIPLASSGIGLLGR